MIKQSRRLPHYCMWCMFGEVKGEDMYCNYGYETNGDTKIFVPDGGIGAAAEDIYCKHFNIVCTRPGADWALALMDAEKELEAIKAMWEGR